jgi:5-methylcytosine-specific restriction endonuclease McrA
MTATSGTRTAYAVLLPLIRAHLWAPDGMPPAGWDERREGSVLKRLLLHRSVSQLEVAILGLAQLRDAGEIEWLARGSKVTTRALYHTRSGVSQMFELATRAYWQQAKRRTKRPAAQQLGDFLFHALRQSASYKAYMRSAEWRTRRAQRLATAAHRCERCHAYGVALEVHHRTYANLWHEPDEDLEVLCVPCHRAADAERSGALQ